MMSLEMIRYDYQDTRGIMRRVLIPSNVDIAPEEGIPVDIFDVLDELYTDTPWSFRERLYTALWRRNIIEVADLQSSQGATLYMAALKEAVKADAFSVLTRVKELMTV